MRSRRFLLARTALLSLPVALALVASSTVPGSSKVPAEANEGSCTFFVSPSGSDRNHGRSAREPFGTLEHAQSALRGSRSKVVCLRAGIYPLDEPLMLTAADDGETWRYYPDDGVNTAALHGGDRTPRGIEIDGASNVTINGLSVEHFTTFGIEAKGGATNVTIENCDVGFLTSKKSPSDAIALSNAPHSTISHNYVHDISSFGIAVYAYYAGQSADGDVVTGNVLERVTTAEGDAGAIYTDMFGTGSAGGYVTISNNYVKDWGGPSGNQHAVYLDDSSSNVTVTGNVFGPPQDVTSTNYSGTSAIFVHNGNHNTVTGNIVDLGNSGHVVTVNWSQDNTSASHTMANNTFTGNIVASSYAGDQKTQQGSTGGPYSYVQNGSVATSDITIQNNIYHNYSTGTVNTTGNRVGDSHPLLSNPLLSGVSYQLAGNSPAYSTLNFAPIVGGWGPPGFVVRETGSAPSHALRHR